MGTHHRAGADSPVRKLDTHSLRLLFAALELRIPLSSAPAVLRESLCASKWREGMLPVISPVHRAWEFGSGRTAVGKQRLSRAMPMSKPRQRIFHGHVFEKDANIACDLTWLECILDLGSVQKLEPCYGKSRFSLYELVFESLPEAAKACIAGMAADFVPNVGMAANEGFESAVIMQLQAQRSLEPINAAECRGVRAPQIKRYLDWFGVSMLRALSAAAKRFSVLSGIEEWHIGSRHTVQAQHDFEIDSLAVAEWINDVWEPRPCALA